MNTGQQKVSASGAPVLQVTFQTPEGRKDLTFTEPFQIGRIAECAVCIPSEFVSRHHVEVAFENGRWVWRDLGSANGVLVNGQPQKTGFVDSESMLRLGLEGPHVRLRMQPTGATQPVTGSSDSTKFPSNDVASVMDHYFGKSDAPAGERTIMIRQAFSQVQKKQRSQYGLVIGALVLVAAAAGGYALYLQQQANKQRALAKDLFYNMKALDLDIANIERLVVSSGAANGQQEIQHYQQRRKELEKNYDKFLGELRVYNTKMSPEDKLILRIARVFGECELNMPPEFVTEVKSYIEKWKSSDRYAKATKRAKQNAYTQTIVRDLLAQDLPPQFFYLAMQESDFDPLISGPPTYLGIAKGMWQFIPPTAVKYGLHVGPLADLRRPDPGDDRHHWELETKAAATYLKDLYSSDAQASGLLVMACYNWGEMYVLPLVQKMPRNPRERNFWALLSQYKLKVPQQTYDYVFNITSAAVIGENPRLFGFNFDNPLGELEAH